VLKIGLTGGIGSGKSTVSSWFKRKGVEVLDADRIAHEVLGTREIIEQIREHFGDVVLTRSGEVNRRQLGKIVFADPQARKTLETITHPTIREKLLKRSAELASHGIPIVVWDVPLLFEAGLHEFVDEIWVVWADYETQLKRVAQRDELPESEIRARISAQMPLSEKVKFADVVIDNSGAWENTEEQLEREWIRLKEG